MGWLARTWRTPHAYRQRSPGGHARGLAERTDASTPYFIRERPLRPLAAFSQGIVREAAKDQPRIPSLKSLVPTLVRLLRAKFRGQ